MEFQRFRRHHRHSGRFASSPLKLCHSPLRVFGAEVHVVKIKVSSRSEKKKGKQSCITYLHGLSFPRKHGKDDENSVQKRTIPIEKEENACSTETTFPNMLDFVGESEKVVVEYEGR